MKCSATQTLSPFKGACGSLARFPYIHDDPSESPTGLWVKVFVPGAELLTPCLAYSLRSVKNQLSLSWCLEKAITSLWKAEKYGNSNKTTSRYHLPYLPHPEVPLQGIPDPHSSSVVHLGPRGVVIQRLASPFDLHGCLCRRTGQAHIVLPVPCCQGAEGRDFIPSSGWQW